MSYFDMLTDRNLFVLNAFWNNRLAIWSKGYSQQKSYR